MQQDNTTYKATQPTKIVFIAPKIMSIIMCHFRQIRPIKIKQFLPYVNTGMIYEGAETLHVSVKSKEDQSRLGLLFHFKIRLIKLLLQGNCYLKVHSCILEEHF